MERAVDIHAEITPPQLLRHVLKERLSRNAGVVDEKTHAAERILHAVYHILHLRAVGDIRPKRSGAKPRGGELCYERVGTILPDMIVYGNGIALVGKTARRRAANAAARAGNKCDLFHFVSSRWYAFIVPQTQTEYKSPLAFRLVFSGLRLAELPRRFRNDGLIPCERGERGKLRRPVAPRHGRMYVGNVMRQRDDIVVVAAFLALHAR